MKDSDIINLILPFKDKLYRYALSILNDRYYAEDVMQELLIRIWRRKEKFVEIDNKQAWCMTVTRNLSIDKLRKNKKSKGDLDISECYGISDKSATPDEVIVRNDQMRKLKGLIDGLSENQKNVIHLRDVDGYSYKEISEITGLTLDQVKINLHRGRKNLRDKLLKDKSFKRN